MEKSTTITEIAKALTKFQSKVSLIKKDGKNPFFKSKYATLENVIETIRSPLEETGLSFSQFPSGENELTTMLIHISGEYLQSTVKMSPKENTPQGQGSAITYMRRYALSAVLGLATEEDDDGNEASKPSTKEKPTKSGSFCSACGSEGIISAKTGSPYCPNWQKHKKDGVKYNLTTKAEDEKAIEYDKQNKEDFDSGKPPFE